MRCTTLTTSANPAVLGETWALTATVTGVAPSGSITFYEGQTPLFLSALFSTGPNTEFGGANNSMCHLDIPMRGSSVALDGRTLIESGKVVLDELLPRSE